MSPDRVDDRPQEEPLDPSRVVPYRRWSDPAIDNDMRIFPSLPEGHDPSSSLWASGLQSPGVEKPSEETSTGGWLSGLVREEGESSLEGPAREAAGAADDSGRLRRTWQSGLDFQEEGLAAEETSASTWLAGLVKVEKRPALNDIARLLFGDSGDAAEPPAGPASGSISSASASSSPPEDSAFPSIPEASASSSIPEASASSSFLQAPASPPTSEPSAFPPPPAASSVALAFSPPRDPAAAQPPLPQLKWPVKPPESSGPSKVSPAPDPARPVVGDPAPAGLTPRRPSAQADDEPVKLPRGLESVSTPATPPPVPGKVRPAPLEIDLLAAPRPTARPTARPAAVPSGATESGQAAAPTVSLMVSGKVSGRDRVSFYRSLAAMFEAGVPVFAIFEFLSREGESQALCDACRRMGQNLVTGMALNAAAMQEPDLFDVKSVRMLEVGYKGGQLEQILRQLADDEEHAWGLKQSLKSQLTYPCGIAMMTMLAVLLMPPLVLTDLLEQVVSLTKQPPLLTRWLLNLSAFLSSPVTLVVLGGLVVGAVLWLRSPKGRKMVDNAELTYWFVPGLGPLWRNVVGLRFLRVFSMVYQAGLPASAGLELAASATGSQLAYRVAPVMKRTLIDGGTLTDAFAAGGFLPGLALESVMAGESSGNVPAMLDNSAMILEAEVQSRVDAVAKLIEPLVLAVLGVIVGVFVLGCLLPIVELTSTL